MTSHCWNIWPASSLNKTGETIVTIYLIHFSQKKLILLPHYLLTFMMTFITFTISSGIPFILISVQWSAPNQSLNVGNNLAWQEKHSYEGLDRKKVFYMAQQIKHHREDWFIWLGRKQILQGLVNYNEIDVPWQGNIHVKLSMKFSITCANIL